MPTPGADEGDDWAPPSSQSHFANFAHFTPNDAASFDDEFSRLASSQQWVPGSQEYTRQRTIAIREELHLHYFSQQSQQLDEVDEEEEEDDDDEEYDDYDEEEEEEEEGEKEVGKEKLGKDKIKKEKTKTVKIVKEELRPEEIALQGYQALCREVGIPPGDSAGKCRRELKSTLVNIVDLIDARRTGKKVKVWENFEAFRAYTLQDKMRIDREEAKAPPGYLASLLQRLAGPRPRGKGRKRNGRVREGVVSGRVAKKRG